MERCRKDIAKQFNAAPGEIIFTSGCTEADNLILQSAVRDLGVQTIITSAIEHHAVLHTVEALANHHDVALEFVAITDSGAIDLDHLTQLLASQENP